MTQNINNTQKQPQEATHAINPSLVPPKPAVRQRALNKQLNQQLNAELTQKFRQHDKTSQEAKIDQIDDEQTSEQKNGLGQELTTLNHYYREEANNHSLGNTDAAGGQSLMKTTKESAVSLPLPSSQIKNDQQELEAKDSTTSRGYPLKVLFIVANEFCERFSFYGFRTILVLYFRTVLNFSDSNSTVFFHLFVSLCYLTPIFGAILADSIWGKFKTILYLSILYFFGEVVLVISSIFWNYGAISIGTTFFGLLMISIGTGGIKPCVSALGGDQFLANEEKWRQSFFSLFYGAINLGSLVSMFLTPMLRSDFKCVGRGDCYPLAFSLPCALMFVAIIVFLLAKNKYNLIPLPEQNVIVAFGKCVWLATKRRFFGCKSSSSSSSENVFINKRSNISSAILEESASSSGLSMNSNEDVSINSANLLNQLSSKQKDTNNNNNNKRVVRGENGKKQKNSFNKNSSSDRNHWLYLASDRFDTKSIEDFRAVLGILLLFVPAPIYWCLYDQQSSLWTLQANRMDGNVLNTGFVLEPDQISVANPLLVLALIPMFEIFIYPSFNKCGLITKPIQRMTVGGLIASLAFVSTALIEFRIQQFLPPSEPQAGRVNLLLLNGLNECSIVSPVISYNQKPSFEELLLNSSTTTIASQQQAVPTSLYTLSHTFNNLQPFNVQSLDLLSSNVSFLDSYQLKFKLSSVDSLNNNQTKTGCPFSSAVDYEFTLKPFPDKSMRLLYLGQGNGKLEYKIFNDTLALPLAGNARVKLLYEAFGSSTQVNKRQFSLVRLSSINKNLITSQQQTTNITNISYNNNNKTNELTFKTKFKDGLVSVSDYLDINVPTKGETFILKTNDNLIGIKNNQRIFLKPGTRNLIVVHQKDATNFETKHDLLQDNDYRISMLYQIVPYILISASEVMYSITGLEFGYAMAPVSMTSVVLGLSSLMNSFGNVLIVAFESMHFFSNIANDFLFYATIMALDMILFAIIGYYFKPYNRNTRAIK